MHPLLEIAVLLLLLRTPTGNAVPLSSFYPYGPAANDTSLPPGDFVSSPAIRLSTPFLFYGTYYSTIYVNNKGHLSFGQPWSSYLDIYPISIPLVAVYQADIDPRGTGSVWYRYTQNTTLLAKVAGNITSMTGTTFKPQWLLIATWDHVGYYSYGIDKTNTFQVILITDGIKSYAIFLYADGLIQWPSTGAQVGFNGGDNVNYANIPGSRTPNILNITSLSNVGVGGQWIFLISRGAPSCGIIYNYTESTLFADGFVKCYDQPYSSYTSTNDLAACNDSQIVFVGAKSSNSSTLISIGAFGSSNVFSITRSTTTAYYDIGGAYWYRYPSKSFGFANSSSVNLNSCDYGQGSDDCAHRLCWHLDNFSGGYRAGCVTWLNGDQTWRKVIYKGDSIFVTCNSDRDECSLGISGCSQICNNIIGSYMCSCYPGYQISSDNRTCVDVNECSVNINGCNQICNNTIGSYMCSCYPGYQISSDNRTCVDVDECALGMNGCDQICTNTNGSYTCGCSSGYQLSSDNRTCVATSCRVAPSIIMRLEDVSVSLNSELILKCQALGCPTPKVTWYKDSVVLSSGQDLVISAVSLSDRGFYMCTAVNQYGYASSNEARISVKDLYQYAVHLELNISVTQDITDQLNTHLGENSVLNNSGRIIFSNISYSGYTVDVLITISANYSHSYDTVINELYAILSGALGILQANISSIQRFDGCSRVSTCANKYIWPESEIGTIYSPLPCVQRRCGGNYYSGGQWEPVITTCATDYLSCAVNELENLAISALNNSKAATQLLSSLDNLLDTNGETISQDQGASKLLNILNYFSNNAIINQTTLFTGKTFATQLEDVNVSNGCLTEKSFSVNLGSIDMAVTSNATIEESAIGSSNSENTTASVRVLPPRSNSCSKTESSVYRLVFHTFLQNTLFPSPEQEKNGLKLGSIIISVGGTAVSLADKLEFSFQISKGGTNALPAQWITTYNNDSYQVGMWSTEGSTVISRKNNVFVTETYLRTTIRSRKVAIFQGNFGMLLDLNPGGVDCTAADVLSFIGTIVSIVCLLLFVITYLFSRPLRKSEHGRVLLNISIALLCLYITYLVAAYASPVTVLCGLSAALVHYFMLVYFMWTASEAVFLYIKLVKVLGNNINHFALKMGLISWLVPLGIVVVSAGAGYRYYYDVNYCRSSQLPFYLGLILPFLIIYVFDWIVFLMIMVSLYRHSVRSTSEKQGNPARDKNYTFRNVLIAAGLSFVLGLGWGFGLAASSHSVSSVACTFQFLFSVFVSSQGLLLLFFHGVRSNDAKNVWRSWIGRLKSKSHVATSSMMGDGTMQRRGQSTTTSLSRTLESKQGSMVRLEEKLFDDTEIKATVTTTVADKYEKSAIIVGEEISLKKTIGTFAALSVLKKDTPEGVRAFRNDSICVQNAAFIEEDEDTTV